MFPWSVMGQQTYLPTALTQSLSYTCCLCLPSSIHVFACSLTKHSVWDCPHCTENCFPISATMSITHSSLGTTCDEQTVYEPQ